MFEMVAMKSETPADSAQTQPAAGRRIRRIFVVDDHPIIRERLGDLIAREPDLQVCGEAENAGSALEAIERLKPDLAIVDITLKDSYGIELIRKLKELGNPVAVLVLSSHEEFLYGERAIRAGAKGYLGKHEVTQRILQAIRTILGGEIFVSDQMKSAMLRKMSGQARPVGSDPTDILSEREREIFQFLGQGMVARQIAELLDLSVKTVEAHREHIKQKMNFKSSSELLRYAIQLSLNQS